MASRIREICINCDDPDAMATFWSAALAYPVMQRDDTGVVIIRVPPAPQPFDPETPA